MVELACLAMPEAGLLNPSWKTSGKRPSKLGDDTPQTKTTQGQLGAEAIQSLLCTVLKDCYIKDKLAPRIREQRLKRIGRHIGTPMGYGFVTSNNTPDHFQPSMAQVKAFFLKQARIGFDPDISPSSVQQILKKLEMTPEEIEPIQKSKYPNKASNSIDSES